MKRYVYVLCLMVALIGLDSCKKNNDPVPDPPVVGTWKLDRVRTTGFLAPYTANNTDNDPSAVFGIQDAFTTKSDKTYAGTFRSTSVNDYKGNWELSSSTLTLKDDKGNTDTYTLDNTKTPIQLLGEINPTSTVLTNPATSKRDTVNFKYQFIYVKQ